jgi:5-methylcytosine-specific restriction protein B
MSLGNTLQDEDDIYQECIDNSYALLGYGKRIDFTGCDTKDSVRNKLIESGIDVESNSYTLTSVNCFKNEVRNGDVLVVSDGNHKFRAIGMVTGDYKFLNNEERPGFQQLRPVSWLRRYEPSLPIERLFLKSLSQMTLYELRPKTIDMVKLQQLLAPVDEAMQTPKPHVLIIDEINRGNISRIFGELITLLESDKRKGCADARSVVLPYSKERFSVPDNVYVVGTMNSADRSLAQIDIALRRRFSFIEVPPNPLLLRGVVVHNVDMGELLDAINQRIEVLLDRDHQIGHAYLLPLKRLTKNSDKEELVAQIFEFKIIPLLQEYFFDDWQRIAWVLNDHRKKQEHRFILDGGINNIVALFGNEISDHVNDRRNRVNPQAFAEPEAYRGVLAVK